MVRRRLLAAGSSLAERREDLDLDLDGEAAAMSTTRQRIARQSLVTRKGDENRRIAKQSLNT